MYSIYRDAGFYFDTNDRYAQFNVDCGTQATRLILFSFIIKTYKMADCIICADNKIDSEILTCPKCFIKVHKYCYGFIKEVGDFICDFCITNVDGIQKKCSVCPHTSGAFKKTSDNKWIHVNCGYYTPEAFYCILPDATIVSTDLIPKWRFKQTCYKCKVKIGAPTKCNMARCTKFIHVSCAERIKSLVEDGGEFILFCEKHNKVSFFK